MFIIHYNRRIYEICLLYIIKGGYTKFGKIGLDSFKSKYVDLRVTKSLNHLVTLCLVRSSFMDRYRLDANPDPDPSFHFETDLDQDSDPQNTVKVFVFSTQYPYLLLHG